MTRDQLTQKQYASKQSAVGAMWNYVRQLRRDGIHTGALSGDGGTCAQWISNDGRTHHASVDNDNNYWTADRKYHVTIN